MPATPAPPLSRPPLPQVSSSFKCQDCGKIIAAPASNPTPRCCGETMTRIR